MATAHKSAKQDRDCGFATHPCFCWLSSCSLGPRFDQGRKPFWSDSVASGQDYPLGCTYGQILVDYLLVDGIGCRVSSQDSLSLSRLFLLPFITKRNQPNGDILFFS